MRRGEGYRDLAKAAVAAEYAVGASTLMGDEARNVSSDALMEGIDREIDERFAEAGVRRVLS